MKCKIAMEKTPDCGKDICCFHCQEKGDCPHSCLDIPKMCGAFVQEETELQVIQSVYTNHFEQVDLQLSRTPRELPKMILSPNVKSVLDFDYSDFRLEGYDPYPSIKADVAV